MPDIVDSWLVTHLAPSKPEDEEEVGKVTLRLSATTLDRLDTLAKQTSQSRTKAATGLLEAATNQAYNLLMWRATNPEHWHEFELQAAREAEEARIDAAIEEQELLR